MNRFLDLDLNFMKNPISNDVNILKDVDAVKRSVRNIVLYNFGEKKFNPIFGGNVVAKLFESLDPMTAQSLKDSISRSIVQNEPRAFLNDVSVRPNLDRNAFDVSILFTVRNDPQPIKLDLSLERIR
jgi:phage baseplate assembly protein W|tara:strand:+ start:77 stop:457 length:381 start_codon:yes stop_codon:yes gene_type:complete